MGLNQETAPLQAAAGLQPGDSEATELWSTAKQARFPGALLPVRQDGSLVIYALAETSTEWRKLQPLLLAFAGPPLTDFGGAPARLDSSRPFESLLLERAPYATACLRPGRFPKGEAHVLAALRRLQLRLEAAPDLGAARPQPTSRLLARLQDALNGGDPDEAWRTLNVLSGELRLDALNLTQLEMQILAAEGRWGEIRWHHRFDLLRQSRHGSATAEILLIALHHAHLGDVAPSDDATADAVWGSTLRSFVEPLLRLVPQSTEPAVVRLRRLAEPHPTTVSPAARVTEDPQARARAALLTLASAPDSGDAGTDAEAWEAVNNLDIAEKAALLARPMFGGLWSELSTRLGLASPPRNWSDWLGCLEDPAFDAFRYAAQSHTDWRSPDAEIDPVEAKALAEAVLETPEGLPGDRLLEAIPYLVRWAQDDPRWPRRAYAPVYTALLFRMALGARHGEGALKSAAVLLEGALRSGLTAEEYRDALDAAGEIARGGLNRNSVYDALEILDVATDATSPAPNILEKLVLDLLAELARLRERLSEGQRAVMRRLGAPYGWSEPVEPNRADTALNSLDRLAGSEIGVYTLTESAGRQARSLLETAVPGMRVKLNHDHGGTVPLAALARNADLFVIVANSAKHAATDFIREKRGGRPLVYAAGRGAASVVRAIEEWAASDRCLADK